MDTLEKRAGSLRTISTEAYQEPGFQERHLSIVNGVLTDGLNELPTALQENSAVRYILAQGIEAASSAFRPFTGPDALPTHAKLWNIVPIQTKKYSDAYQQTGPIGAKLIQPLFESANIKVSAADLIADLKTDDLIRYCMSKLKPHIVSLRQKVNQQHLYSTTATSILQDIAPPKTRDAFTTSVIESMNHSRTGVRRTQEEKTAMNLMFVFMNQLWKVQQVHRTHFEAKENIENIVHGIRPMSDIDMRITQKMEYQTYTGLLKDAYKKYEPLTPMHGMINAALVVQKDLYLYRKNIDSGTPAATENAATGGIVVFSSALA
jgi:hypothetical protein